MKKDAEMRGGPDHREWPPKGTKKGPQKSKDVKEKGIITKIPQYLNSRPMQNKKWSENGMGWDDEGVWWGCSPPDPSVGPTSYSYTLRIYLSSINPSFPITLLPPPHYCFKYLVLTQVLHLSYFEWCFNIYVYINKNKSYWIKCNVNIIYWYFKRCSVLDYYLILIEIQIHN